ncbi:hypothetical protein CAPTEDRAFT_224002 [Capitella teleta]|uniref:CRAL-TRIO domain-containing protein n=1 Tax=Capitella teleta TaxID=283909 RepID=R7TE55_CAPTE|nr:hypothetical protein CAPTEDRAFT_224002 [Capitella teleta]|eukprot:ELT89737.1 hypothetical protein CAPTEDRAFT_224002 [Capitella teleta]
MAELNPKPEEVLPKIGDLRSSFATKFKAEIDSGAFDARDVSRLQKDDQYAACFLRTLKSRGDVGKALEVVADAFKFRKEIGINDLASFKWPEELMAKKAIYYKGFDTKGHPILYINVKENSATKEQQQDLRKFIAYNFEQHHSKHPEQMCVVLMDMSGAGVSNMNLDITKFIITCFTTYFPAYLAYMINYEMPMLLGATWSVVSAFLSSDQKKKLLMINKKQIKDYIPAEHLWDHMK